MLWYPGFSYSGSGSDPDADRKVLKESREEFFKDSLSADKAV
jgi:hypothetical protein